jgi:hypothetical protein
MTCSRRAARAAARLLPLAMLAALAALAGCDLFSGGDSAIRLPVSALDAPATVARGAALDVVVTVVLTNGCRSFDRLEATRAGATVTIEAWGRDVSGPGVVCTLDVRYEPHPVRIAPPLPDSLRVVAPQPDRTSGGELTRVVRVQ